ncbi:MAG: ABC transporter ATP-binding protein, partial [Alphaproteobacteria bacterium]|nr:ABC transporter ATP-binding protein [Alphaproteobacteria bacterium]
MARLELKQVKKAFGPVEVIHGIDLAIEHGEFVVFVGPSGCGKSTLLRLICGLDEIDEGTLAIDGEIVNDVPPAKRGIAMVFQSYALYPHMSVAQNMGYALRLADTPRAEIDKRVGAAAEILRLTPLLERKPRQLSGGQRQRVAIGRAIVREPRIFLFDEPLSNLDASLRVDMRAEIAALKQRLGTTMIYVTHDQEEANAIADRIAVLDGGRIQQLGVPMALYDRPANRFVAAFLGTANLIEGDLSADGNFRADGFALAGLTVPKPGKACVSFRPHDVTLSAEGRNLAGTIQHREFLGGNIRYVVRVGPHRVTVDTVHRR